ncbi:MAG: hypothetical protein AB1422_00645 [bacterium]
MKKIAYSIILGWLLIFLLPVIVLAQLRIEISSIGQKEIDPGEISVSHIEDIRGKIFNLNSNESVNMKVQVAIQQEGNEAWRVQEVVTGPEREGNWKIARFRFGKKSDYGKRFKIVTLVVSKNKLIREGVIDYDTLQRYSVALSNQVDAVRNPIEGTQSIVSHIRIDYIGEQSVAEQPYIPGKFIPVAHKETLSGEVCKTKDAFVQVVVQPVEGSDRWIMSDIGKGEGKIWKGIGYFGREGLVDTGKKFLVYSIVSKERLPEGHVLPSLWEKYKQDSILALSPEVKVIRVDRINIVITMIDDKPVDGKKEYRVCKVNSIEGTIEMTDGHAVPRDYIMWVFIKLSNGEGTWILKGRASRVGDYYWKLPPVNFGNADQHLMVIAAVSRGEVEQPNDENVIALSREVYIILEDRFK